MARQAASPWNNDFRRVTANPSPNRDFKLEVDGKEVPLETYQEEQKKRAFAMRGKR